MYFQICFNQFPLLGKAPMARFFGGEQIEEKLSAEKGKTYRSALSMYIAINLQIILIILKTINSRQPGTVYINRMRANIMNNFLNFFNSKTAIITFIMTISFEIFSTFLYGELENKYVLSQVAMMAVHTMHLLIYSLPYRGYPLRSFFVYCIYVYVLFLVFRRYCWQRVKAYFVSHENILNEHLPRISTISAPNMSILEMINVVNVQETEKNSEIAPNASNVSGFEMINVLHVKETDENSQIAVIPEILYLPPKRPSVMTSLPDIC